MVWKLSRFARNREDSIIYKSLLRKQGVQVISINERVDDSAAGKLLEGMIEVIDEFYSTNLAEDVMRGMAENVEKGFYNGGPVPFGYQRQRLIVGNIEKSKLEPDEVEVPVVKSMFKMALDGQGAKGIAKALNRDGLTTRKGKRWSKTVVNKILRNEIYTGAMVWNRRNGKTISSPNSHPALVSKDDFDKVQQLLTQRQPKVTHPRTIPSKYLLSSLLRCGYCGAPMIGCSAKSGKFSYYRCNKALRHDPAACRSGWLPKSRIENFVIDRLKQNVLTDENLSTLARMVNEEIRLLSGRRRGRLDEIEAHLESVNQRLLKYHIAFEKGTMSDDDCAPRIREFRTEQTRLQRVREEAFADLEDAAPRELDAEQVLGYVRDLKALLSKGTFIEQKAFLKSFIKRIDFEPGQVAISYTIPVPIAKGNKSEREVLSIEPNGGPLWSRTTDLSLIRTAL